MPRGRPTVPDGLCRDAVFRLITRETRQSLTIDTGSIEGPQMIA
ncbi:hypothetical protein HMPREF9621_00290 [Cutibacterium modestum HL037PA2]|uniref:Uncharacterized protein n=1 Tax=Cutibacterium modestum HL044PA1 TaxID=765109 RepID=A0ABN0C251_9ACTN|nr:hypothetical protein HMPREF9621_00290 [Cutibacterium modestum HL037PA2]EFS91218.1 hypothetical protein HMPREF9607_02508 [Cutibacterium modestum HL044PA1]